MSKQKIIAQMVGRNEEDRFLKNVLSRISNQVDEIVLNIVDDEGTPIIDQNGEKMRFYPLRELQIVDYLELDDLAVIEY